MNPAATTTPKAVTTPEQKPEQQPSSSKPSRQKFSEVTITSTTKPAEVPTWLKLCQAKHLVFETTQVFKKIGPHLSGCQNLKGITVRGEPPSGYANAPYKFPNDLQPLFLNKQP